MKSNDEKILPMPVLTEMALEICKQRGWSTDWSARGTYLFLEAAELIESLRGKGDSTPTEEAADVLFVLLSIIGAEGIHWSDVQRQLNTILNELKEKPRYEGESHTEESSLV